MKALIILLSVLVLILQYQLWFADGGAMSVIHLYRQQLKQQQISNNLQARNQALVQEVADLKQGNEAIEERARRDLHMVKQGEVFFQIIDSKPKLNSSNTQK